MSRDEGERRILIKLGRFAPKALQPAGQPTVLGKREAGLRQVQVQVG